MKSREERKELRKRIEEARQHMSPKDYDRIFGLSDLTKYMLTGVGVMLMLGLLIVGITCFFKTTLGLVGGLVITFMFGPRNPPLKPPR